MIHILSVRRFWVRGIFSDLKYSDIVMFSEIVLQRICVGNAWFFEHITLYMVHGPIHRGGGGHKCHKFL